MYIWTADFKSRPIADGCHWSSFKASNLFTYLKQKVDSVMLYRAKYDYHVK